MNPLNSLIRAGVALVVVISASWVSAQAAQAAAPAAALTNALPEIPKSVFIIPLNAKEGRNPFFPNSSQALPIDPDRGKARPVPADAYNFVLNGITSPPKRTAMINGRTFEAGESGEVKLSNGARVLIKCVEIRNDSAIIDVDGQRRELRLRFGV